MHKLAQSVLGYIRKLDLFRPGDRVGVAVSGGIDSVALLRILLELRQELGFVLSVVHLNHKLRGGESDADEKFVRDLANTHELQFLCESRDVKAGAAEKKLSIETAARELRYEFFRNLLRNQELDRVATAHTLDDQAETVLLKLLRGTGTRGLAGIYPIVLVNEQPPQTTAAGHKALGAQRSKAIVRPLLATRRADLEQYLAEAHQAWREDSSNLELRHTRNRIRHEILPLLQKHVNANVRQTLSEAAEIARAEEESWTAETERILPFLWTSSQGGGALLCDELNELDLALRRRLVRAAAESLGLNLEFGHVEEVLALSNDGAQTALPNGWMARRHKGQICFQSSEASVLGYEYRMSVPGKVEVPEAGIVLSAESFVQQGLDQGYNPDGLLDMRCTGNGLVVRNWRAGDRFWPSHTKAPKKIKELLQGRHVTGEEKRRWPVIVSRDKVVWLRGFGVGRDFQTKSSEGVLIREEPLEKQT